VAKIFAGRYPRGSFYEVGVINGELTSIQEGTTNSMERGEGFCKSLCFPRIVVNNEISTLGRELL
jgi:hypothetical protein